MKLIKRFRLSASLNNALLILENNKYILIDAPNKIEKVIAYLEQENIILSEVWLTHCHYDHVLGLPLLKETYPKLKVYIADKEMKGINDPNDNLLIKVKDNNFSYDGEILDNQLLLEEYPDLQMFYISGHSLKSTCYYFPNDNTVFAGDSLFRETIGRSDMIYGSQEKLIAGIKKHLLTLPKSTTVYPGHGFMTTIEHELANNQVIK